MIEPETSIAKAMEKMFDRRVTSLIIEESPKGDTYGIITRKDIINKVIAHEKDPKKVKVCEIMSKPLLAISSDLETKYVAGLLARSGVRRFGVVEDGELVGLISNSDVLRAETLELLGE